MSSTAMNATMQAELAGYQLFLQCASGAPADANLYLVCAHSIRYFLQPPAYDWVPGLMIAFSVLYALLCLTFAGLVVLRATWGNFWLFRREQTAFGTVIVTHTINFTCIMSCIFFGLGLGTIWTIYQIATIDSVDQLTSSQLFSGLTYYPIWLYAWADACSIFLNLSNWRNQPLRQRTSTSKRALVYNAVSIGVPIMVLITLVVLFSQLAMQGMNPSVAAANAMRAQLYRVAPTWTGQVVQDDLQPLLPAVVQLLEGANQFDHWQRICFGFWIGAVGVLYAVWIPLVTLHVRQLLGQISNMRSTIRTLNRTRAPSVATNGVPTYVLGANEKTQRVSIVDGTTPRQADKAERRIRWLLRVCIFRVATAICITAGIGVFASICFLVVIDPRGAASSQSKNFYCRIGALFVPLSLALPGIITAVQHPRQTTTTDDARSDIFSQMDRSLESGISPWRGLEQKQTEGDESSTTDKGDEDSAIFQLPTVNSSPVRLYAAQHVMVDVETVVHVEDAV